VGQWVNSLARPRVRVSVLDPSFNVVLSFNAPTYRPVAALIAVDDMFLGSERPTTEILFLSAVACCECFVMMKFIC